MAGLCGVKAITEYVEMSESTVMKWINREGLPAAKIGGTWVSDTLMINKWRAKRIAKQCKEANEERW